MNQLRPYLKEREQFHPAIARRRARIKIPLKLSVSIALCLAAAIVRAAAPNDTAAGASTMRTHRLIAQAVTRPIEALEQRQMLAADTYDWKAATIKANGFIDGIVYSPAEAGLTYIHTDMGGAYRYDASKSKWTSLTDFATYTDSAAKSMGTETLAVDPTDANRVYVGLGTYNQPSAVLRSTDRGVTWSRTNVPFVMNGNGSARNTGERMMVDPNSPNILYYGTRVDGLWKSTDYAATWSKVTTFPTIGLNSGFGASTGLLFTLFDKSSSTAGSATKNIYVGVFDPTAGVNKIYRSTDAGVTWAALPGGQPTLANLFPQRAALSPDGNSLYITYATSTSYPGPYGVGDGNVYKVTNPSTATPTWADVSPPVGYAFSAVTLDPTNANTVYVSELGDYNPADRIWRSTNGGSSWAVITPNSHRDDSSAPYASASKVHWMGDVEIDPSNHNIGMFTTGYGLYRTTNLTATEPNWTFFNDGFEQTAVIEFASPPSGPVNLFSAIGDRDGYRHVDFDVSPAAGALGQNNGMSKGTSPDIDIAWNDPNYLVRVTQTSPYVQASKDNGVTWSWLSSTGVTGGDGGHTAISGDGTRVIYEPGGTGNQLLYATRTGTAWSGWTAPASGRPADGSRILVDLVNAMTFYAQSGQTITRSTDGGVNWTTMTTSAPSGISWVRAVPGNAGHLVASAGGNGVYRSKDGGATWSRLSTAVSNAYAVGVGAAAPGKSYPSLFIAGTANGLPGFARSDDEGVTWVNISDANHQYGYVDVIQGDPRVFGRIYVGTNGRGIQVGEPLNATGSLPDGWQRNDIGSPALAGQSNGNGTAFTLAGDGTGFGATSDQFHFASESIGGDGSISARVVDVANTNALAQAGAMLRASIDANSPFAMASQLANGKVVFSWRTDAGSSVQTSGPMGTFATANYLRVDRAGDTFTASYSGDGVTWVALGAPVTIAMPVSIRAGLAATAASGGTLAKATFTNVNVSDLTAPTIASATFEYQTIVPDVAVTFSEDVSSTLSADDLIVVPVSGGDAIVPTSVTYDPATNTARFILPSTLSRGDYHATLAAGVVADRAGNDLASSTSLDFFHLPGDVNRDRSVNFSDLLILAQHFGQTDNDYSTGDLTGDRVVGFADLLLLAQNFGQSLGTLNTASVASSTALAPTSSIAPRGDGKTKRVAASIL